MNIIVSAFITNINNRNDRNIDKYIEYGKILLNNINCYKVIFIEKLIYEPNFHMIDEESEYIFTYDTKTYKYFFQNNTIFVLFEKMDIYLYNYIDKITNFNVNTDNPLKDTLEYMFVQCHKTEWVKMAIQLVSNIKNNTLILHLKSSDKLHFMWVDFGIYHMFNNNIKEFNDSFKHLSEIDNINHNINHNINNNINHNNKIRISSCINPTNKYNGDIYKHVAWFFAGSVFGGSSDSLTTFADLMKIECVNIIHERNHLMWEINIWYLIYLKNPELFDPYNCAHDSSIIVNY